jgi:uncharacterized protein (TIGR04222 family)
MRSDHAQLLVRIESFDIDGTAAGLPFAARLARENGWSRLYADRVIAEYKRFVYLAMISDTPVCPSEDVDAAWHLHLTYTRSYWQRFCDCVLGRPLHHEPTRGGPSEHAKHLDMYSRTLARYRAAFGANPPTDIWPTASDRFGEDLAHRTVNTARNWVIPKAAVKRAAALAALFAVAAIFVPGCNGNLNPFELKGTEFLNFLIPMLLAAMCLGRLILTTQRGPAPADDEDAPRLSWEEVAYLAGGPARLATATVAKLVAEGNAEVVGDRLVAVGEVRVGATPVERTVLNTLPVANTREALSPVAKAVDAAFNDEARKLEADGYLLSSSAKAGAWVLGIAPLLVVLLGIALPRFVMAINHDKPTEYLLITAGIGAVVGLAVIGAGLKRLTRRGEHALTTLKEEHRELQAATDWDAKSSGAMAVALFGTMALAGTSIAYLANWYPRQTLGSGGCGTAGCGTGGCAGGAGGCAGGGGGCGGGGCGGCGGD